jgi:catalase-peroxidase
LTSYYDLVRENKNKIKKPIFLKSTIAGLASIVLMTGSAIAETAEMTKPKGAIGTGSVKEGQPKSNQFW